jgi:hypothetical protein
MEVSFLFVSFWVGLVSDGVVGLSFSYTSLFCFVLLAGIFVEHASSACLLLFALISPYSLGGFMCWSIMSGGLWIEVGCGRAGRYICVDRQCILDSLSS